MMKKSISSAYKKLQDILFKMGSTVVSYSGGLDSTLLLKVASDVLKDKVIAVTASAPIYLSEELKDAKKLAKMFGVKHVIIRIDVLDDLKFLKNSPQRCYYCKSLLFKKLRKIAYKNCLNFVVDGVNKDDIKDFRPGLKANIKYAVRSPLKEAGLTKKMIRELSKELKLPTYDKPPIACLASRIPYGTKITTPLLEKIDALEKYIKKFGISQIRTRHHDSILRIEVPAAEFELILKTKEKIIRRCKKAGYRYITIDLEGYRAGSMNFMLDDL